MEAVESNNPQVPVTSHDEIFGKMLLFSTFEKKKNPLRRGKNVHILQYLLTFSLRTAACQLWSAHVYCVECMWTPSIVE